MITKSVQETLSPIPPRKDFWNLGLQGGGPACPLGSARGFAESPRGLARDLEGAGGGPAPPKFTGLADVLKEQRIA